MKDFDHLLSVWQAQPKPDKLSVDDVLKQVKKGMGSLSRKLMMNIISMGLAAAAIFIVMLFFAFKYPTTYAGILIILSTMVIYTWFMIRDYRLLNQHDATMSPSDYLQSLKEYQRGRAKVFGWMYYLYVLLLTIGLSLYFFEVLSYATLKFQLMACGLTAVWLLFCTFYLKDRIFKNEQDKLNLMIDRLIRLQGQFEG
jgi:hypothetical protein